MEKNLTIKQQILTAREETLAEIIKLKDKAIESLELSLESAETSGEHRQAAKEVLSYMDLIPQKSTEKQNDKPLNTLPLNKDVITGALFGIAQVFGVKVNMDEKQKEQAKENVEKDIQAVVKVYDETVEDAEIVEEQQEETELVNKIEKTEEIPDITELDTGISDSLLEGWENE